MTKSMFKPMFKPIASAAAALGLSLAASSAMAESTAIYKTPVGLPEASKSQRFVIDADLGRAWVEIDTWQNTMETNQTHRVSVPGLSYDKAKAQVVYQQDGQAIACADVRKGSGWIFKQTRIEPTGQCELTQKYVKVPIDDGFSVDVVEHFEVHFKPVRVGGTPPAPATPKG